MPGADTLLAGPSATSLRQEPSLDGLRGIAVAAVLLYHAAALAGRPQWLTGGFLGVSLFFVISGYLMVSLMLLEHQTTGTVDAWRFAARRVRRLVPASLVVVIASILLALPRLSAWSGLHASDALAGIWGVMNWQVIRLGPSQVVRGIGPIGPYWSLAVETQFYVALALLAIPMRRSRTPRRWVWGFAALAWALGAASQLLRGGTDLHREFGTDYRVAELATGMVLALVFGSVHRNASPSQSRGLVALGAVAACTCLAGFLWADFDPPWLLGGGFLLVAVVAAVWVHVALTSVWWRHALSVRPLVWVGKLSYSLYLVHWPVGLLLNRHASLSGATMIITSVVATLAAASVLHRLVEQPPRHWSARPRTVLLAGLGASVGASLLALAVLP